MMCKEMKQGLKKMRNLRDRGRKQSENSRDVALGFVGNDDEDYDGALLVDGGAVHSKDWVIDSRYSFHIVSVMK